MILHSSEDFFFAKISLFTGVWTKKSPKTEFKSFIDSLLGANIQDRSKFHPIKKVFKEYWSELINYLKVSQSWMVFATKLVNNF